MKIRYSALFIFAAILFTACEKNVLDKGPLDVVDENTVWTDPSVDRKSVV